MLIKIPFFDNIGTDIVN